MAGKTVSPGFLFASLLWHQVLEKWQAYQASGEFPIPALHMAADEVLESQTEKLAIQRKIGSDMRDIWAMQPRFERRNGKNPYKLLEHLRFRAGYDFLLLRCASGEIDRELGDWWTAFYEGDESIRAELVSAASSGGSKKKKAAPRRGRKDADEGAADLAAANNDADEGDEADDDEFLNPRPEGEAPARKRRRRPRRGRRSGGSGNAPAGEV
jgi:poly(A) polymerase